LATSAPLLYFYIFFIFEHFLYFSLNLQNKKKSIYRYLSTITTKITK